jgi:hypothetical protein
MSGAEVNRANDPRYIQAARLVRSPLTCPVDPHKSLARSASLDFGGLWSGVELEIPHCDVMACIASVPRAVVRQGLSAICAKWQMWWKLFVTQISVAVLRCLAERITVTNSKQPSI